MTLITWWGIDKRKRLDNKKRHFHSKGTWKNWNNIIEKHNEKLKEEYKLIKKQKIEEKINKKIAV